MRDRLVKLIDGFVFGTQIAVNSVEWDSTKVKELADYLLANGVIFPPCKVADLPDRIFSHNSIIAIWAEIPKEHSSQRLWRGMAWDIPEKYKELQFKSILGIVPECIYEGDTINVLVDLTKEKAEQALGEKRGNNA